MTTKNMKDWKEIRLTLTKELCFVKGKELNKLGELVYGSECDVEVVKIPLPDCIHILCNEKVYCVKYKDGKLIALHYETIDMSFKAKTKRTISNVAKEVAEIVFSPIGLMVAIILI